MDGWMDGWIDEYTHTHASIDIYKFITIYYLHICIYKYALNSYRNLHSIHSNICSIIATCLTSNCGNGGAKDGHIPQAALESDHGCLPWLRSGHHLSLKGIRFGDLAPELSPLCSLGAVSIVDSSPRFIARHACVALLGFCAHRLCLRPAGAAYAASIRRAQRCRVSAR